MKDAAHLVSGAPHSDGNCRGSTFQVISQNFKALITSILISIINPFPIFAIKCGNKFRGAPSFMRAVKPLTTYFTCTTDQASQKPSKSVNSPQGLLFGIKSFQAPLVRQAPRR